MLAKKIYTLWGRNRFLLPVTYFPTNLVYPFNLRVTGVNIIYIVYGRSQKEERQQPAEPEPGDTEASPATHPLY